MSAHPRDAAKRSARSDGGGEPVDAALRLRPDFRAGGFVMALPVGGIVELIGPNRAVWIALGHRLGDAAGIFHIIVGVRVGDGGDLDQLRPNKLQHVLLFLGLRLGDHDDGSETHRRGDHANSDAGIAGGSLDDRSPRPQGALGDGVLNDGERRAVLDGPARVHKLGLPQNFAARCFGGRAQADQRRVADGFDDRRSYQGSILTLTVALGLR